MHAPMNLIRKAQWAVNVLCNVTPDAIPDVSSASAADLEAFVKRAEDHANAIGRKRSGSQYSTSATRRTDLFPSVEHDTVIAQTFRWLLDRGDRGIDNSVGCPWVTPDVPKRELMDIYHVYSTRKTDSRSSFSNNLGPYCAYRWRQGTGALIESYLHKDAVLRKDGKPRTTAVKRTIREINPNNPNYYTYRSEPTGERRPIIRQHERVKWIGPTIAVWLRSMLDVDLDRALALMERRLTAPTSTPDETSFAEGTHDDRAHSTGLNARARKKRMASVKASIDEEALAKRWIDRINAEIARRAHAAA